jgi:outer membrane protein assembly factor BamB
VDWPTYGYDAQRTGESPDTTITSANVGSLRVVWAKQGTLNGGNEFNLMTQPIVATNVPNVSYDGKTHSIVYIGGGSGNVYAFDAQTGVQLWTKTLPTGNYTCYGTSTWGVQGTFALDRANGVIYVPDGLHKIHALDLASGADRWSVDIVAPGTDDGSNSELRVFLHTGLNLVNGKIYAGTSGVCDLTPWRGRLVVVDVATHTLQNTIFTAANATGVSGTYYSGGGVWGWGGASAEPNGSAVYTGVGNADQASQSSPFVTAPLETVGYAEHIVKFPADLSTASDSHAPSLFFAPNPLSASDIDLAGTPTLFQPPGCPPLLAVQGKEGYLFIYNRTSLSAGPIFEGQFSVSSENAYYMGLPAYSRQTGYLYASIATAGTNSGYSPGLAILQPNAGCTGFNLVATPAFGIDSATDPSQNENPRSSPTVVNDVVFIGTPDGILWARNAKTGAALWDSVSGGAWGQNTNPGDEIRYGPVVTGGWVYVVETQSASIYALTVNSTTAATQRRGALAAPLPAAPVRHPHHRRPLFQTGR